MLLVWGLPEKGGKKGGEPAELLIVSVWPGLPRPMGEDCRGETLLRRKSGKENKLCCVIKIQVTAAKDLHVLKLKS